MGVERDGRVSLGVCERSTRDQRTVRSTLGVIIWCTKEVLCQERHRTCVEERKGGGERGIHRQCKNFRVTRNGRRASVYVLVGVVVCYVVRCVSVGGVRYG